MIQMLTVPFSDYIVSVALTVMRKYNYHMHVEPFSYSSILKLAGLLNKRYCNDYGHSPTLDIDDAVCHCQLLIISDSENIISYCSKEAIHIKLRHYCNLCKITRQTHTWHVTSHIKHMQ